MLDRIGALHEIEKRAREYNPEPMTPEERHNLRQGKCAAVLSEIKQLLENPGKILLQKSDIANAIGCTLDHWGRLKRYLEHGWLEIGNIRCENAIRSVSDWMKKRKASTQDLPTQVDASFVGFLPSF